MAQWMNLQRIKRYINPMQLYITREKSGGRHLVKLGLTAGNEVVRQLGGRNLGEV